MNLEILSNLIITKVYSVTTMYTEKNTKIKRNNRPNRAIVIKYEGETIYTVKEKDYLSDINNLVILPKGCSYDWHCFGIIMPAYRAVKAFGNGTNGN